MATLHDFTVQTIDGDSKSLADFGGRALLVVNVASRCGFTPQYEGLETLHRRFSERGFAVLGFPCNQFGAQEPGSDEDINRFCTSKYDVTFPLFSKIEVNGSGRAPVYAFLTSQKTSPLGAGDVQWNFEKFLVDKTGQVVARFPSETEPEADAVVSRLEEML